MARLSHRIRGLPDAKFLKLDAVHSPDWMLEPADEQATLFVDKVCTAGSHEQQALHDRLARDMAGPASLRLVLASRAAVRAGEMPAGMSTSLFAFLRPFRLDVPALRFRTEDLDGLVRFIALSAGMADPIPRFMPDALEALHKHQWPENVAELELVIKVILKKRPSGSISCSDLPVGLGAQGQEDRSGLMPIIDTIARALQIRSLRSESGRLELVRFLERAEWETFRSRDVQHCIAAGEDTARRLLKALEEAGLVKGLTGAGGRRVTRYQVCRKADNSA